jgi:acyl carrier protein
VTAPPTRTDEAVATIARLLEEVVGADYLLDVEIGPDTSFAEDIELESIDLVALTEQLELTYGRDVDFAGWIADMELDDIIALTVGDLAGFVVRATSGEPAA